jgi:hypothetical protein
MCDRGFPLTVSKSRQAAFEFAKLLQRENHGMQIPQNWDVNKMAGRE